MRSLFPIYFMLMHLSIQFAAFSSRPLIKLSRPNIEGTSSNLRTRALNLLRLRRGGNACVVEKLYATQKLSAQIFSNFYDFSEFLCN